MVGQKKVFLREATGLVREMKWYDALFLNFLNMSIGLGAAWVIFFGPGLYPSANVTLGLVVCAVGCLFGMACFALLTTAMPRSGGDYVFVSRCLHPSLGFASNWMWVIWNVVWCGVLGTWVVTWGLRDLFGTLGVVYNNSSYLAWASELSAPDNPITFTLTASVVILTAVMLTMGFKTYLRVQAACAIIGMAMLIIAVAIFATTSNDEFQQIWDNYAAQQNAATYDETVADAANVVPWYYDWSPTMQTLGILPIGFWVLAYPYFSAFLGGELKRPKSTAPVGNMGAVVIGAGFIIGLWLMASHTLSQEFIVGTYGQLYDYTGWAGGGNQYMMPSQWFDFQAGIISGNPIVIYLIGLGMIGWLLMYPALAFLGQTRSTLAWSMDRVVPKWFGKVSDRWHTPVNAIIFFLIINLVYLAIYAKTFRYQTSFTAVAGQLISTFLLVGLSAIVLPFRKRTRRIYLESGIDKEVLGIPIITICGVVWVGFLLVIMYFFFLDPNLGAIDYWSEFEWSKVKIGKVLYGLSIWLTIGFFLSGFLLWWVARWHRKRHGIDIDLAYKELPPE
jgi:amino acid transporter